MAQSLASAIAITLQTDDPVLTALLRAPEDDLAESEEERLAVATAKASRRLVPHAAIENAVASRSATE